MHYHSTVLYNVSFADYRIPHHCKFSSCPTKSFPGLWEIPLNSHYIEDKTGGQCSYLDQCVFTYQTPDDVFNWLKEDFLRHYEARPQFCRVKLAKLDI